MSQVTKSQVKSLIPSVDTTEFTKKSKTASHNIYIKFHLTTTDRSIASSTKDLNRLDGGEDTDKTTSMLCVGLQYRLSHFLESII